MCECFWLFFNWTTTRLFYDTRAQVSWRLRRLLDVHSTCVHASLAGVWAQNTHVVSAGFLTCSCRLRVRFVRARAGVATAHFARAWDNARPRDERSTVSASRALRVVRWPLSRRLLPASYVGVNWLDLIRFGVRSRGHVTNNLVSHWWNK